MSTCSPLIASAIRQMLTLKAALLVEKNSTKNPFIQSFYY